MATRNRALLGRAQINREFPFQVEVKVTPREAWGSALPPCTLGRWSARPIIRHDQPIGIPMRLCGGVFGMLR